MKQISSLSPRREPQKPHILITFILNILLNVVNMNTKNNVQCNITVVNSVSTVENTITFSIISVVLIGYINVQNK
jgi:hypothetical protein